MVKQRLRCTEHVRCAAKPQIEHAMVGHAMRVASDGQQSLASVLPPALEKGIESDNVWCS